MTTATLVTKHTVTGSSRPRMSPSLKFLLASAAVILAAGLLAARLPVQLSVAIVFLFAGPHNWMEFRYLLSRLPSCLGSFKTFFLTSAAGVISLSLGFIAIAMLSMCGLLEPVVQMNALSIWCSTLAFWIAALLYIRKKSARKALALVMPPALILLLSLAWFDPYLFNLSLVYMHPLVALAILDRELARRPQWKAAYRVSLLLIPVCLFGIWSSWCDVAILETNKTTLQLAAHTGADVFLVLPPYVPIAAHAFLELIHYGVWLLAIPAVTLSGKILDFNSVPISRKNPETKSLFLTFLCLGGVATILLWIAFCLDYSTTRSLYFTFAVGHVLVELPVLIRMSRG